MSSISEEFEAEARIFVADNFMHNAA